MRIRAIVKRICIEIFRDKRTLALLFLAPLLILTLMNLLFHGEDVSPRIGIQSNGSIPIEPLKEADFTVVEMEDLKDPKSILKDQNLDAVLAVENNQLTLVLKNSDPTVAKKIQAKITQVLSKPFLPAGSFSLKTDYVYGNENTVFFDTLSPILIGFFVFFFVFLISGIGFLKERTSGTLERILATPLHRAELVFSYLFGFGLFAVLQTVVVVLYAINVLNVVVVGSIWLVILINLILAIVALTLGTLLSSFASSEFQMIQFIPLVIVPQIFFSGIFPLEGLETWLQVIAKIMPLTYAAEALKGVMYMGWGFSEIILNLAVLLLFACVFIMLNIFALKKYRVL